jgi:hypothetical protein
LAAAIKRRHAVNSLGALRNADKDESGTSISNFMGANYCLSFHGASTLAGKVRQESGVRNAEASLAAWNNPRSHTAWPEHSGGNQESGLRADQERFRVSDHAPEHFANFNI